MKRISECFNRLRHAKRTGLITFITAGDPTIESTLDFMHSLVKGGADIIELGVPFSDPMADGPIIQRSSERSLAAGTDLQSIFEVVRKFRLKDGETPIVLMGYMNPFEKAGFEKFAAEARKAGIDGLLIVDLPPEEATDENAVLRANSIDQIFLVAPNSSTKRVTLIGNFASGFVYFVSVKGVTGDKGISVDSIRNEVESARSGVQLPIGVGFGIRTAKSAKEAAQVADAVVVGSALVEIIEQNSGNGLANDLLGDFVADLRSAVDV